MVELFNMNLLKKYFPVLIFSVLYFFLLSGALWLTFLKVYEGKIFPNVFINGKNVSGWTKKEVEDYFVISRHEKPPVTFILKFEGREWVLGQEKLKIDYNGQKLASLAYNVGRTGESSFIDTITAPLQLAYTLRNKKNIPLIYQFNNRELDKFLGNLSDEINIEPEDALFNFDGERINAFRFAKNGRAVDTEKIKKIITDKIIGVSAVEPLQEINIPTLVVPPAITNAAAENLGIRELLGRGVSYFYDSIPSRVYNIQLSSSKFNGVLIKPGETFSFLKTVGKITKLEGYKEAYVINEGKTVLGDGGGVCQVSTTIYRAALFSGLPIVERTPHAYRVGYYEPPVGFDATIYQPGGPDLKFKNDTGHYILIQTIFDETNMSLTFELYGTTDGRVAQISDPVIVSTSSPPPARYQDDPGLPRGVEKQIDTAHGGAKVYFTRRVVRENDVLIDEKIWSNYIPWAAVILRGTR